MRPDGSTDDFEVPPELAWMIGKNAPSLHFVRYATRMLGQLSEPSDRSVLEKAIRKVKDGSLVLDDFTNPSAYLDMARPTADQKPTSPTKGADID